MGVRESFVLNSGLSFRLGKKSELVSSHTLDVSTFTLNFITRASDWFNFE